MYERYVFNTCVQQSDESVQSYVIRLRKLAASCEYGERTDDFIRHRLVIGLKDNGDKVRLLREKKLDLQKAIQMCTSSEVASQQMKKIQGVKSKQTEEVKKLGEKKKTAGKPRPNIEAEKQAKSGDKSKKPTSSDKCRYCGRQQRHVRRTECPAFGQTCSNCQKKGHVTSVCHASKKVHQLEDSPVSSSDESCLRVETVSLVQIKAKQWFTDIKFFKSAQENFTTALACQLDTRATCNVISLDDLSAITQLGEPPLNESSVG